MKQQHGGDIYGDNRIQLDFSVNTNPLGMPEAVRRAVKESGDAWERYPDCFGRRLRAAAVSFYQSEGLPAGALCNPGLEAINAALYPAETDYYYFLVSDDGVFYYAQTVEQHEQNIIDAALHEDE